MEVQAECPWCGTVTLSPGDVRCATDPGTDDALCEITCPACERIVYARTTGEGIKVIKAAGARGMSGLVPFELLERRSGPALRWEEVLDLVVSLHEAEFPQAELIDAMGRFQPRTWHGAESQR